MVAALILSGGTGSRMGAAVPKQFLNLKDKPILLHTVERFCSHPQIGCVCVVSGADFLDHTNELLASLKTNKPLFTVTGGKDRRDSSKNGLEALSTLPEPPDFVLIHDAARPLVPDAVITNCIEGAKAHGACTAAIPSQDTIAVADHGMIADIPPRSTLYSVQTPQGFAFDLIVNAHRTLEESAAVTDDTSVMRLLGHPVALVEGDKRALKITTQEDLVFAESLLNEYINKEGKTSCLKKP